MQLPPLLRIRGTRRAAARALLLPTALAWLGMLAPQSARSQDAPEPPTAEPIEVEEAPVPEPEPEAEPAETPSSSGPPPGVEVMRVRGRGIAAIETDVPSSVTQFDAATIEALGAQDISDLSRVTPNVNIVQPGATQATFFVRGIGLSDFSSNAAGAVTIFQDDVSINAPAIQTGQLFDIEAVEVVRGPQGTGPFRNASAGAIRVRSRRPTGNYGAQLRSSLGRYAADGGKGAVHGLIQDYEGYLESPIVEDVLSSRFAFRFRDAEPYKTNGCADGIPFEDRQIRSPGDRGAALEAKGVCGEGGLGNFPFFQRSRVPPGLPEEVGDEYNWAARGIIRFQPPGSETEFFLSAHGSRLDQDATLGQVIGTRDIRVPNFEPTFEYAGAVGVANSGGYWEPDLRDEFAALCPRSGPNAFCPDFGFNPIDVLANNAARRRPLDRRPYRGDYNLVGDTTRDAYGGFASAETVFHDLDVFALVSYDQYERTNVQDLDFTPELLFESDDDDEAWQTYEELRISGELAATPFRWEIGGYHLQETLEVDALIHLFGGGNLVDLSRDYTQKIQGAGAWWEFQWDFADDFTLEGGVRWNWEKKRFEYERTLTTLTLTDRSFVQEEVDNLREEETWRTPTGQIILTYHIDANASAYGRYTRGFKAGHFNSLASERALENPTADEEYNDAWETGLSGRWFDRRLSLLAAFFYYRYENYQVFLFTSGGTVNSPPFLEILNAKRAENYGIEVEGRIEPLRGFVPRIIEGLRLSGNFSWLHGEYIDFQQIRTLPPRSGGQPPLEVTIDYSGQQLQNGPVYKAAGTAEWTLDFGRWGFLIPRYDINWSDDVFFDPNEGRGTPDENGDKLPEFAIGQPAFFLHNVRLAYRTPTGNVEVAGWVRNLTDEAYRTYAFDSSAFARLTLNFVGEPRTIGMDVTITF